MDYCGAVRPFIESEIQAYTKSFESAYDDYKQGEYMHAGAEALATTARITLLTASVAFAVFATASFTSMVVFGPIPTCVKYGMIAGAAYGGHYAATQYDLAKLLVGAYEAGKDLAVEAKKLAMQAKEWYSNWNKDFNVE